jgi:RHS repeat-associated protein
VTGNKKSDRQYFGARYYDPRTSVWQSADPILGQYLEGKHSSGVYNSFNMHMYGYAAQNPLRYTDPDGRAFWMDDAIGIGVGALVGAGVEVEKDILTGEEITAGGVLGAAAGGALMGEGIVNAPETLGGSIVAAGAARGAVVGAISNTVQQATDIVRGAQKGGYSAMSLTASVVAGTVTGGLATKIGSVKVPGISSGSGNMKAVAQAVKTRIENGNASKMSAATAVKGAIGGQVADAGKTAAGAAVDAAKAKTCQSTGGCD